MPKAATCVLVWSVEHKSYELHEQGCRETALLSGDDECWQRWLVTHTSFSFQGRSGQINLLKETRKNKGEGYWYAYRRHGKRVIKRYVGRSVDLSLARLETIAQACNDGIVPDDVQSQQRPLLAPKLRLPHLHSSLIRRSRLLAKLDAGLDNKLLLLSAPAGSGKTTLVRQWVEEYLQQEDQLQVAWVSLDAGDNDPVRFWRYVFTACEIIHEAISKQALTLLTPLPQPTLSSVLEIALTTFLNALTHAATPGILILEDYHVITSSRVHETVAFLLDHLPPTFHLLIISRHDPPLPLARLLASGDLCSVQAADLRFSQEETALFFQQALVRSLSPQMFSHIEARLQGWAAGLRLFALLLQDQVGDALPGALTVNPRSILDYFVSEVLHVQPQPLQHFLLQTSVLSRLTGSLCDAVTERRDSAVLLDALEHGNLFLELLDGPGQWYRYHALFAEAMQLEAQQRLGKTRLQEVSRRASSWYEQHGMLAEAIEAAFQAADETRAADLIERFIDAQIFHLIPEMQTLRHWLEQISMDVMQQHPMLCLSYAVVLLWSVYPDLQPPATLLAQGEALLRLAEASWCAEGNSGGVAQINSFRSVIAMQQGKEDLAVSYASSALAGLSNKDQAWRGICLNIVGGGELLAGRLYMARQRLLEARELWQQTCHIHAIRSNMLGLGAVCLELGELHLAAEYLRQVLTEAREVGDRDDIAPALLALAQLFYEWNDLSAAEQAADEAHTIGSHLRNQTYQVQAMLLLVRIWHVQGQSVRAQQRLAALLAQLLPEREPRLYHAVLTCQARLLLMQEEFAAAQRCVTVLEQLNQDEPERERVALLAARLLLTGEKAQEALEILSPVVASANENGRICTLLEAQLLMMCAYTGLKQAGVARRILQAILPVARREGYLRLFLDEGDVLAILLRSHVAHLRGKSHPYLQKLLSAFAPGGEGASLLPQPLSAQEQRVLRLLVEGRTNQEIALELVVSINTVKAHVKNLYRKLNVSHRLEASVVAQRLHLL
ncbi:helix-turn-helix transcriptional regulator [Reticulibacter mediterranei]|uniref:Helix-turn-helix transcriptional regulator n=1 Tax=Reticulibacter mediterranei TaxID=2778369 RepID=A0A8J3IS98_9CHLR|nr:LuxR C-terminal-related transcriptional regulator [Reticulibacter mediterranei]GHO94386.1 helix-turn-helix transcriptional regulator [Reticulibacter mediterranei]